MARRPALYRVLIALLAMFTALSSSTAALAYAANPVDVTSAMSTKSDCADMGTSHDCATSCVLLCGAIASEVPRIRAPAFVPLLASPVTVAKLAPRDFGPAPPPPRAA
ncbi:MAG: hypothetical protein ABR588_10135 [Sphingomicrobium sp.]|nr:hypothetical protein [Sphingomonadales bacterium]